MKKGFTLIELLAVILILGIIALIAIPQVTNVIDEARKGAAETSAKNYLDAINDKIALAQLDDISSNDIQDGIISVGDIEVNISGEAPESGTIEIARGKVKTATLVVNGLNLFCYSKGRCIISKDEIAYKYYQNIGPGIDEVEQGVDARPTDYSVYLKYPIEDGVLGQPQVCYYNGSELCVINGEYDVASERIISFFEGDNTSTCTSVSGTRCSNSSVIVEAGNGGSVRMDDLVNGLICSIAMNGFAECDM